MSKKHFIALADALRGADLSQDVLNRLCQFMANQNGSFMRGRWLDYLHGTCGPNGGKLR